MSMDDIYHSLQQLAGELEQFNDRLRLSIQQVNELHDRVHGLWQDSMRHDYDARWLPLKETMDRYVTQIGPAYVEWLQRRIQELTQYLYGNQR